MNHSFLLRLEREPTDAEFDELADVCHDAAFGRNTDGPYAEFDRDRGFLVDAIASAVIDLSQVGLRAVGAAPVDLLLEPEIADRLGLSDQELAARVAASPIAHSKPMRSHGTGGEFYSWAELAPWLDAHGVAHDYDAMIAAADTVLSGIDHYSWHDEASLRACLLRRAEHETAWARRWRMPEWMLPYLSHIANTGGPVPNTVEHIERLRFRLHHERNLGQTNVVVWAIAHGVDEQIGLLRRLHAIGALPATIEKGPW